MIEVGNAKDLANFEDLSDSFTRLGEAYQPSWREPPAAQRNPPARENNFGLGQNSEFMGQ